MVYSILVIILLFSLLVKLPFINIPLDRDYGIYGYHGLFFVRGQKIPYKDTLESHTPGRWLLYALLLKYFPVSRSIFRIVSLVFLTGTNILVFYLAQEFGGSITGLLSAASFAILSSLPVFVWTQSNDELEQIFFTTGAIVLVCLFPSAQWWLYPVVGIVTYGALLFKQSAYVNTVPVIALALLVEGVAVWEFLLCAAGFVLALLCTLRYLKAIGVHKGFHKMIFVLNLHSLKNVLRWLNYHQKPKQQAAKRPQLPNQTEQAAASSQSAHSEPISWNQKLVLRLVKQILFFGIFALAAAGTVTLAPVDNAHIWLLLFWFFMAAFTVYLNKHLMSYHFLPLLAPLSILAGLGLVTGYRWLTEWQSTEIAWCVIGIVTVLSMVVVSGEVKRWITSEKSGRGRIFTNDEFEQVFYRAGESVGKYLAPQLKMDDRIYVWGAEYEIYLWAGRPSPAYRLFCPREALSTGNAAEQEEDLVNQLQADLPRYIVITSLTDGFNTFRQLVADNYELERKMYGEIEIHRRIDHPTEPLTSIIILTWNAIDYTRKCVESIQANTTLPHELIFVDNNSSDDTLDYLQELVDVNDNYSLISNSENCGFAAGNNQGMKIARGDYIFLLNNDVLVAEGWLERMLACAESDEAIGLVGPLTNRISGLQMIADVPYSDPAEAEEYARRIAQAQDRKYTPRRRIAGFAMLIKRTLYDKIGGLDEDFGSGNFEDDDYCLRATEAGFKIMVAEDAFIHHFGSATFEYNRVDYDAAMDGNRQLFSAKWPEVDLNHLMERDQSLCELNDELANQAQTALEQADSAIAIECYQKILATNPVDIRAIYGIGLAEQLSGDQTSASGHFQRVLMLVPEFASAYQNLGQTRWNAGDIDGAIASLLKGLELEPWNGSFKLQLAEIYQATGKSGLSLHWLKQILKDDQNNVNALDLMGRIYLAQNRTDNASLLFRKILQIDPDNENARNALMGIN